MSIEEDDAEEQAMANELAVLRAERSGRVDELEGDALDYLVWCAENGRDPKDQSVAAWAAENDYGFHPSKLWEHGGPIIEREGICLVYWGDVAGWEADIYPKGMEDLHDWSYADSAVARTPLVAAMRCYVKSKFGEKVPL